MKKRTKQTKSEMGDYLRLRIPPKLKETLATIASSRSVEVGRRSVTVSDVAREYLLEAAAKEKTA